MPPKQDDQNRGRFADRRFSTAARHRDRQQAPLTGRLLDRPDYLLVIAREGQRKPPRKIDPQRPLEIGLALLAPLLVLDRRQGPDLAPRLGLSMVAIPPGGLSSFRLVDLLGVCFGFAFARRRRGRRLAPFARLVGGEHRRPLFVRELVDFLNRRQRGLELARLDHLREQLTRGEITPSVENQPVGVADLGEVIHNRGEHLVGVRLWILGGEQLANLALVAAAQ